jgi:hypothetical protein
MTSIFDIEIAQGDSINVEISVTENDIVPILSNFYIFFNMRDVNLTTNYIHILCNINSNKIIVPFKKNHTKISGTYNGQLIFISKADITVQDTYPVGKYITVKIYDSV